MTSTIARTLGLFDGVDRPAADALPAFLADRSLLLVLDNFEHLLEAAGDVATLVRASPGSRFVVTSRAPLRIGGEQEYPVRPLAVGERLARDRDRGSTRPRRGDPPVHRSGAGGPAGLGARPGPADRRRDLRAARRAAARHRAGRRAAVAAAAGRHPRPARGAPAAARLGTTRRPGTPADARGRDRLEPRPAVGRGTRPFHALAVFEGGFDVDQAERVIDAVPTGARDALDRLIALAEHSLIARDQTPTGDAGRWPAAGSGSRC